MFKTRVFLVIGSDFSNRKRAIESIRKKIPKEASPFLNDQTYYSKEIDLIALKSALLSFSFGGGRVMLFKDALTLSKDAKNIIFENIKVSAGLNHLIFEIDDDYYSASKSKKFTADPLFSMLLKQATVIKLSSFNNENLIRKLVIFLRNNDCSQSIYMLNRIFKETKNKTFLGVQILGAVTREFSYTKDRSKKEQCFRLIWDTDRILKEGKADSQLALELLIAKIYQLS